MLMILLGKFSLPDTGSKLQYAISIDPRLRVKQDKYFCPHIGHSISLAPSAFVNRTDFMQSW